MNRKLFDNLFYAVCNVKSDNYSATIITSRLLRDGIKRFEKEYGYIPTLDDAETLRFICEKIYRYRGMVMQSGPASEKVEDLCKRYGLNKTKTVISFAKKHNIPKLFRTLRVYLYWWDLFQEYVENISNGKED